MSSHLSRALTKEICPASSAIYMLPMEVDLKIKVCVFAHCLLHFPFTQGESVNFTVGGALY